MKSLCIPPHTAHTHICLCKINEENMYIFFYSITTIDHWSRLPFFFPAFVTIVYVHFVCSKIDQKSYCFGLLFIERCSNCSINESYHDSDLFVFCVILPLLFIVMCALCPLLVFCMHHSEMKHKFYWNIGCFWIWISHYSELSSWKPE